MTYEDELVKRLVDCLRPEAPLTVKQTYDEMKAVRVDAEKNGLNYNSLMLRAIGVIRAEKKSRPHPLLRKD